MNNSLWLELQGLPGFSREDLLSLERKGGVQSMQFMIDILPFINKYLKTHEHSSRFRVLDVGVGAGFGTDLLARLYASGILGYKFNIDGLDIRSNYHEYCNTRHGSFNHVVGDIYDEKFTRMYDIVICSHVIEHVANPSDFIRRLREIARNRIFVAGPFNEPPAQLTRGHIHSFNNLFFDENPPDNLSIILSPGWGAFMEPPYEMFIAEYGPLNLNKA